MSRTAVSDARTGAIQCFLDSKTIASSAIRLSAMATLHSSTRRRSGGNGARANLQRSVGVQPAYASRGLRNRTSAIVAG